jgi:hypothetical protein
MYPGTVPMRNCARPVIHRIQKLRPVLSARGRRARAPASSVSAYSLLHDGRQARDHDARPGAKIVLRVLLPATALLAGGPAEIRVRHPGLAAWNALVLLIISSMLSH